MSPSAGYREAARSWTEHLRAGGTTPWAGWSAGHHEATVPDGWTVPGAAELELVRRLAARGLLHGEAFTAVADVVLGRSGPGRGLAQQPLSWPASPGARRFGAPPVDPADVPEEELVRLGVGALTDLLLAAHGEGTVPGPTSLRRRPLTRTPTFALTGAPVTSSAVRRALGAAGHAEGGRSPRVLLVAAPLDESLAQVWSARVQRGAPVRWPGFVQRWSGRRHLPPAADLPAVARQWAIRVGPGSVHVIVSAGDPGTVARTAAGILGVGLSPARRGDARALVPRWRDLSPEAVDVLRRVNAVLRVRAAAPRREVVLRGLVRTLDAAPTGIPAGPTASLTVPEPFQDWAGERAARLVEDLRAGGYPVHGRLDRLVPRFESRPTHPRLGQVLDLVLETCLRSGPAPHPKERER